MARAQRDHTASRYGFDLSLIPGVPDLALKSMVRNSDICFHPVFDKIFQYQKKKNRTGVNISLFPLTLASHSENSCGID